MIQPHENPPSQSVIPGVVERRERGLVVLSSPSGRCVRRVLFVNNYGGAAVWDKIKRGLVPPHHLWGCLELVRMGYEVALAEPLPDFDLRRRPLPHDFKLLPMIRSWMRPDDIVYCGHNVLYWVPLLRALGLARRHVVSLLFARETLDFGGAHSGIVALTPSAAQQAAKLAPKAKRVHLGWGADLNSFPIQPYNPRWLLHCGISGRDFGTLQKASLQCARPVRIVSAWGIDPAIWPPSVEIIDGGAGHNHEEKKVTFSQLLHEHYAGSGGSLITTIPDPPQQHAFGFTNLIEALAMSQPVIMTRTGALIDEIDVEREGCGLVVPPEDPAALAAAMEAIMGDPARAAAMGRASRRLCESHYNIARYANELHSFFESF